jgi:hypothetical protein
MSKRNSIIKYFVVLAGMLSPLFCAAQNGLEVFRLEYGFYPGNTLENKNGDTFDAGSQVFTASFRAPVFISQKWQILGSAQFENFQAKQDEYVFLKNISGVAANFTALRRFEKWSFYAAPEIKYSSDKWTGFLANDLIFRGSAGVVRLKEGTVRMLGLGVGASSDFGVPTVVPVFFFRFEVNKKLQFEAILPLKSRFSYHWKPKTYIGLQHFMHYNAFVVSPEFRTEELKFGKIRNINGAVFCEQKLHRNLWLTASGGAIFRNAVFLYDENRRETDKLVGGMNYFVTYLS